jgi:hypothetical protein
MIVCVTYGHLCHSWSFMSIRVLQCYSWSFMSFMSFMVIHGHSWSFKSFMVIHGNSCHVMRFLRSQIQQRWEGRARQRCAAALFPCSSFPFAFRLFLLSLAKRRDKEPMWLYGVKSGLRSVSRAVSHMAPILCQWCNG